MDKTKKAIRMKLWRQAVKSKRALTRQQCLPPLIPNMNWKGYL